MQVVIGGQLFWMYILLISLQLWGRLSASTSSPTLPAPELHIYLRSKDSVTLICRAPEGHRGVLFMLYRFREKVDSQAPQSGAEEVHFTVSHRPDSGQHELFCCLYMDHEGRYSAFSAYLQLEHQKDAAPTRSTPSFPPPVLSVQPSTGVVKHGDILSFNCSVPVLLLQSQSSYNNKPVTFFLLKTSEGTGPTSVALQHQASLISNPEPQPGVFIVGPVRGEEEGDYTCLYQITRKRRLVNSTVSNVVQVTITDVTLPTPTLVLEQQTDVWHLLCTGSPAYPGAVFYLYLSDNDLEPVDTHHATLISHQATFPVPVQDTPLAFYQCQYSFHLGGKWSDSKRSLPLAVTRESSAPSPQDVSDVDWPLILGSCSAVVLFLCSVAILVIVARTKVKAAAEEKKRREDAQFWTQVHARDHVVDLPLQTTFSSQEWASVDKPTRNSLSTFTTPIR